MTIAWLQPQGVLSLKTLKKSLLSFVEPPYAAPHVPWSGETARKRAFLPDFGTRSPIPVLIVTTQHRPGH